MSTEKRCCHCKEVKPLNEFNKDKQVLDGYSRRCCICASELSKKYYQKKYKENPEYFQNAHLKQRFGMTIRDYDIMAEKQNGVCAICSKPEMRSNVARLSVDHNHNTGQIRGLLCDQCNRLLGTCKDDITILNNAIKYLREFE